MKDSLVHGILLSMGIRMIFLYLLDLVLKKVPLIFENH